MTESICLTVYFDGSFWLGRLEWREAKRMRVATYTFGQEPTNPQLLAKLPSIWQDNIVVLLVEVTNSLKNFKGILC